MYNYISCGVKNTFVVEFIYLNGLSTRKLNLEDMHHIYCESLLEIVVHELGDT